jgi:hypothetical protein
MRRHTWLLMIGIVLITATSGAVAWAYAHRSYRGPVYYEQWLDDDGDTTQQWIDPRICAIRIRWSNNGAMMLLRDGNSYNVRDAMQLALQPAERTMTARLCAELRNGGWRGVSISLLAHAVGRIEHVRLYGHGAIHFVTSEEGLAPLSAPHSDVWLEAETLALLQTRASFYDTEFTHRFLHMSRLAPHTLPVDFFDPGSPHHSPWDAIQTWLRDHGMQAH